MIYHNYLETLLGSKLKIKVIRTLYRFKERSFTLRELSKFSNITHQGLLKVLEDLSGMNLVKLERISKSTLIKLNRNSFLLNVLKIYDIENNTLNELVKTIKKHYINKDSFNTVALFGSIVKNEERFNSDIDLLIITKNKELANKVTDKCNGEVIKKFGNVIMPYILTKDEFRKSNIRKDVIDNHILIKDGGLI